MIENKISAIKLFRLLTGDNLRDSKASIEEALGLIPSVSVPQYKLDIAKDIIVLGDGGMVRMYDLIMCLIKDEDRLADFCGVGRPNFEAKVADLLQGKRPGRESMEDD